MRRSDREYYRMENPNEGLTLGGPLVIWESPFCGAASSTVELMFPVPLT